MDLRPLDPRQAEQWRKLYRAQLRIPVIPDFHEALCRLGRGYLIEENGQALGYLIQAAETLIPGWAPVVPEFFIKLDSAKEAKRVLTAALERLAPKAVVGRTDDDRGFPLLLDLRLPNRIVSPLYLLNEPPAWAEEPQWLLVESTLADAQRLLPLYSSVAPEDGGIPDEMSLIKSLAAWRHYRALEDGEVAAAGYAAPQGPGYVSVTVLVKPEYRGHGLGRHLAAFAMRRELAEGKTCVATVNPSNEPGRRLMESLGSRIAAYFVNFSPEGSASFGPVTLP